VLHKEVPTPIILGRRLSEELWSSPLKFSPDLVFFVLKLISEDVWGEIPTRVSLATKPRIKVIFALDPLVPALTNYIHKILDALDS
jgi:hypothetical protein